jgi:predicted flap endonuclease-1-like 5' DNA nuclease
MSYKIQDIEGIGPSYAQKLAVAKVRTTNDLLKYCCDTRGRMSVGAKTGVSEAQLLKWANMADLMRISGVGSEFSELLEAAGVDTVKELRNRNAENLAIKMKEVNRARRLTRTTPSAKSVQKWIIQAGKLAPVITH